MGPENIETSVDTAVTTLRGKNLDQRAWLSCQFLDRLGKVEQSGEDLKAKFLEIVNRLCPAFHLDQAVFSNGGIDSGNAENQRLTRGILAIQIVLNDSKLKPDGVLGKNTWDAMNRWDLKQALPPIAPEAPVFTYTPVFADSNENPDEVWPDPTNRDTGAFAADSHLVKIGALTKVSVVAGGDGNSIEEIHKKLLVNRELIPDIAKSLRGKVLVLGGLGNDVVEGNELADVLRNYREIVNACKKQVIKVVILKRPPYAPGVRAVHKRRLEAFWKALEEEFKDEKGVKLINLDANFADEKGNLVSKYIQKEPDGNGGFKTDEFHLNTKGYRLMITALREAVVTPPTTKISGLTPTDTSTNATL
jgi:lysophospholipase L1-like esterase